MAARRPVQVPLAGLLVLLLLLLPAVADAGGHGPGGAGATAADPGAGGGERIAAATESSAATALAASPFAGGRGYRAGSDPEPEVSRAPARPDAVPPQAGRVRGSPDSAPRRGGEPESAGHPGGRHRGPPAADPVPLAAPARSAHEGDGTPAGRGRKAAPHLPVPVTDGAETPDPVLLLRFLLVLGFRRVRPGNVLDHPLRRAVHAAIGAEPGLDLAGCVAATGGNRETLRYHLALLVCCGKVVEETRSGSVRYFPHDPALTPVRRALLHAVRNESLGPLLAAVRDAPGISRSELAGRLCVAGPSVTRQVQRLIDDGLVEAERCGRSTCYRLTAACAAAIDPAHAAGDAGPVPDRAPA